MALYEKLCSLDVAGRLKGSNWYINDKSGLFTIDEIIPYDSPWIFPRSPEGLPCRLYHDILFNKFGDVLGQPPSRCQECWKVVVRPDNVKELKRLHDFQDKIKEHVYGCKCGIETRPYVNALYGGYFYNRSIEEGQACAKMVRSEFPAFLKRGCTEYEMRFGDSDKWEVTDEQLEKEKMILSHFEEPFLPTQPVVSKIHITKKWIEFACQYGDETYLDLVDEPLHAEYVRF